MTHVFNFKMSINDLKDALCSVRRAYPEHFPFKTTKEKVLFFLNLFMDWKYIDMSIAIAIAGVFTGYLWFSGKGDAIAPVIFMIFFICLVHELQKKFKKFINKINKNEINSDQVDCYLEINDISMRLKSLDYEQSFGIDSIDRVLQTKDHTFFGFVNKGGFLVPHGKLDEKDAFFNEVERIKNGIKGKELATNEHE